MRVSIQLAALACLCACACMALPLVSASQVDLSVADHASGPEIRKGPGVKGSAEMPYTGPGAQAWRDLNDPDKCPLLKVEEWVAKPSIITLPAPVINRAVKGVPPLNELWMGRDLYMKYHPIACGPSSNYRALAMMGYPIQKRFSFGQWLQAHPFLLGATGTTPERISAWLNKQGFGSITRMGPKYQTLAAWLAAITPELKAGRPVMILLGFHLTMMHYVNVLGYEKAPGGTAANIAVLDPNRPANVKLIPARDFDLMMKGPQWVPNLLMGHSTTILWNPNPSPPVIAQMPAPYSAIPRFQQLKQRVAAAHNGGD